MTDSSSLNPASDASIQQVIEDKGPEYTLFKVSSSSRTPLMVTVSVNHLSLSIEVDTGPSYTALSKQTYNQLFSVYPLESTDVHVYGQLIADIQYLDQKFRLELIAPGEEGSSLLGRNWLSSLRLDWNSIPNLQDSRLDGLLSTYSSVFTYSSV